MFPLCSEFFLSDKTLKNRTGRKKEQGDSPILEWYALHHEELKQYLLI